MATKDYVVVKAVKVDKIERVPGDIIPLEAVQAARLMPVFVDLVPTTVASEKKAASSAAVKGKGNDGL